MAKVVRKDKMQAGYDGNLESVKIYSDSTFATQVQSSNGVFVVLGGLEDGEREVRKAYLAGEADATKDVLFIHNAEVMYDERLYLLEEFVIDAGKVARGYRLYDGDIITLTTDLFSGTVAVGDELIVQANGLIGKPSVAGDLTTAKVVFEVIEDCGYELHQTTGSFAVSVKRN